MAARGLDIVNVDYVIHYEIPSHSKSFIHRSGRCGRNNQHGVNISLITDKDKADFNKLISETKIEVINEIE